MPGHCWTDSVPTVKGYPRPKPKPKLSNLCNDVDMLKSETKLMYKKSFKKPKVLFLLSGAILS